MCGVENVVLGCNTIQLMVVFAALVTALLLFENHWESADFEAQLGIACEYCLDDCFGSLDDFLAVAFASAAY